MRNLLLIFSIALLGSCSVKQMNNYHCKRCPTKDSVSTVIERHDSLIEKIVVDTVPGDTIRDTVKAPCKDFKYHKENKRQKVTIEVKDGELVHESICKEWEFKYKVSEWHHTLTEKTFIQKTRTIYEKEKKKCNWWLPFILGNLTMLIIWQRKRILGLILRLVKPV